MRNWITLAESVGNYAPIEHNEEYGSVEGYVVGTHTEHLQNWLENRHKIEPTNITNGIRKKFSRVAFLNNINVEEDARGNGYGNDLLEWFLEEAHAHGAEVILLLCDTSEEQQDGFNLCAWYEAYGFEVLDANTASGPLMIKVLDQG